MARKTFKVDAEHNLSFPTEALLTGLADGWNAVIYIEDGVNPDGDNPAEYGAELDAGVYGNEYQFMQNTIYSDDMKVERKNRQKLSDFITSQLVIASERKTKSGNKVKRPRRNKIEFEEAVNFLGESYVEAIREYIDELEAGSIPNRQTSNPTPLYESGTLYDSIKYLTVKE